MMVHCEIHGIDFEIAQNSRFGAGGMCPECAREILSQAVKQSHREIGQQHKVESLEAARKKRDERFDRIGIPPRFRNRSFDNYQATSGGQQQALRRCRAYSERLRDGAIGGLILRGNVGNGKTHLACAAGMIYEQLGKSVLFLTVVEMVRKLRESYGRGAEVGLQDSINYFRDLDLLILDEVGMQSGSDDELMLLTDVINARYGWMKPTVLITNLSIPELEQVIGARNIDRMCEDGGALIEFGWESFRSQAGK